MLLKQKFKCLMLSRYPIQTLGKDSLGRFSSFEKRLMYNLLLIANVATETFCYFLALQCHLHLIYKSNK